MTLLCEQIFVIIQKYEVDQRQHLIIRITPQAHVTDTSGIEHRTVAVVQTVLLHFSDLIAYLAISSKKFMATKPPNPRMNLTQ